MVYEICYYYEGSASPKRRHPHRLPGNIRQGGLQTWCRSARHQSATTPVICCSKCRPPCSWLEPRLVAVGTPAFLWEAREGPPARSRDGRDPGFELMPPGDGLNDWAVGVLLWYEPPADEPLRALKRQKSSVCECLRGAVAVAVGRRGERGWRRAGGARGDASSPQPRPSLPQLRKALASWVRRTLTCRSCRVSCRWCPSGAREASRRTSRSRAPHAGPRKRGRGCDLLSGTGA